MLTSALISTRNCNPVEGSLTLNRRLRCLWPAAPVATSGCWPRLFPTSNKAHSISWWHHRIFDCTNISPIEIVVGLGWVNEYKEDLVVEMWKVVGLACKGWRSDYDCKYI